MLPSEKTMYFNQTCYFFFYLQIKMKETLEEEHEFVENVLDLEIPSLVLLPTNSEVI